MSADLDFELNSTKPFLRYSLPSAQGEQRTERTIFLDDHQASAYIMPFDTKKHNKTTYAASKDEYTQLVSQAKEHMHSEHLHKVVTSRIKVLPSVYHRVNRIYKYLLKKHPQAFVYLLRLADGHIWMAASPEILLQRRGNTYSTVALAGTQPIIQGREMTDYTWGSKEIKEQQLVADFILSVLENNSAKKITCSNSRTVAAANVVHLKSEISFESNLDLPTLIQMLHPTPAVCGTPREEAMAFIREFENHDRSLYTGVIGCLEPNNDLNLFVNLRCMCITPDATYLYAGGGILADSDPDKEWNETEWKMKAMLEAIEA